jgi:N-acetylmuramoyl-L-alanine amidase
MLREEAYFMEDGIMYDVQENDCISSIAFEHGHFWKTVWEHSGNQSLRAQRRDPNVLYPGDRVFIPALRDKWESRSTEERHKFRRKGVPGITRFQLIGSDGPHANVPCRLVIDGRTYEGRTDSEGTFEVKIPPNAQRGTLTYGEGEEEETYDVTLGGMDPVTEPSGALKRLQNLGYMSTESEDESLEAALKSYQLNRGIEVTGRLDAATQQALLEDHGC